MIPALPTALLAAILLVPGLALAADAGNDRPGVRFTGTGDRHLAPPSFAEARDWLPIPILPKRPEWVRMYWTCWELAFRNIQRPGAESLLISNYLDAAFANVTGTTFQWDSCFMMMFTRYGHRAHPLIHTLDNFYARQRANGLISREIDGKTGRDDRHFGHKGGYRDPQGWINIINPPLFAWAEWEVAQLSGDTARFDAVLPTLEAYASYLHLPGDPSAESASWTKQGRRAAGTPHDLFWNTDLGSGMDDTPRPARTGSGWVDMSSQMVLFHDYLARMYAARGREDDAARHRSEAAAIGERINRWCWDEKDGFYYDVLADGSPVRVKTLAGFWPLLARIVPADRTARLVTHLRDGRSFWRPFLFPTLAADEPGYRANGHYWRGAVWPPTNHMVLKGLEISGQEAFAAEAAERYLEAMAAVYARTGTVYENYMPDRLEPSSNRGEFVGWSGLGPISTLIEQVLGFRVDALKGRVTWRLARDEEHGISGLRFGAVTADLRYDGRGTITVRTDGPFILAVNGTDHPIPAGTTTLAAPKPLAGAITWPLTTP